VSECVLVLGPCLGRVGSTLQVKVGVVGEDTGLLDVTFVVVTLLLGLSLTELLVLRGGKSGGDVRLAGLDLSLLELLYLYIYILLCIGGSVGFRFVVVFNDRKTIATSRMTACGQGTERRGN